MTRPLASFRGVTLGYGRRVVLEHLDFDLPEGDYFALVGPNGAGKTTLLRALVGGLRPLSGQITRRPCTYGYVPQRMEIDELFPATVFDLVMMGRYARIGLFRGPRNSDRDRVGECLERVGMAEHRARSFRELSGGQRQRVLMARALATEPEVLLLDEPTNGMDLASEQDVMELVDRLHQQGLTVFLVTHALGLVANHARTLGILGDELTVGPLEEILTSERLTQLYGRKVRVEVAEGERVILVS
ncbi:MAG: metal ABC transporter ATP-binding protein [Armatimonadetes bacterium]|nr:metal ABC transporter ATP-binding protein [Armatimonadota bacterium]